MKPDPRSPPPAAGQGAVAGLDHSRAPGRDFQSVLNAISNRPALVLAAMLAISFALHWRVLRLDLISWHSWRQTETQTVINNFVHEDFNILNPRVNDFAHTGRIFRMEFPIMQWLFAGAYRLAGTDNIALSRTLTFLLIALTTAGIFRLTRSAVGGATAGLIAAWAFLFSPVIFYYAVCPLPDNFALCCAVWSMAFFWEWKHAGHFARLPASAGLLALATAAKLPFVIYLSVPGTWALAELIRCRGKNLGRQALVIGCYLAFLIPPLAWYVWVVPTWAGNGIVQGVLAVDHSQTNSLFGLALYHLKSMLPKVLLGASMTPLFLAGWYFAFKDRLYRNPVFWTLIAWGASVLCYFAFELNMIARVHDYYLFPFLPLLGLIIAFGAVRLLGQGPVWSWGVAICLVLLPFWTLHSLHNRWNAAEPGFNPDLWKYRAELRAATPHDARCIVGNDISHYIWLYHLDRQGWVFERDQLSSADVRRMVAQGARYLYTDSDVVAQGIAPMLDSQVLRCGTLRVYRLRSD
jgi:4-amino-4-deoxy-L-arabinose transferase-like glycosyltransferase